MDKKLLRVIKGVSIYAQAEPKDPARNKYTDRKR
jgi:hypothetical protein